MALAIGPDGPALLGIVGGVLDGMPVPGDRTERHC